MLYARTRLMLLMLPMLLIAGACADRAENATGQAALERQRNQAHWPDSGAAALTKSPTPVSHGLRQQTVPAPAPQRAAPVRPAPARQHVTAQSVPQPAPVDRSTAAPEHPEAGSAASEPVSAVTQIGAEAADSAARGAIPVSTARAPRTVTMTVPIGAVLSVSLNQELSTQDSHVGDTFTTTLQEPFVDRSTVLLPAGAVIQGRVTAAQQSTRVGRTAVLKLAFDSVRFDGHVYPFSATVMEANPERRSRSSTTETAGKIAAGAAAGALLGRILGKDTRSTVAGAALGAAAGTAIALGTQDVDAVLPKDSRMVIRVDRPMAVEVRVP